MSLHMQKENVLLAWVNSLGLGNPVDRIVLLQDGILFLKLICKLKGQEVQCQLDQPVQERLQQISDFLQRHCRYKADRGSVVSWENILNGRNLDIELSKVVLLLMHHVIMNELLETEKLDHKTMFQMAAVLRFVLDIEDVIHLSDNMETFLKKPFLVSFSSVSTESSISEEESPILKGRQLQNVKFLELMTVASSSAGSPIKEILNTPQFQLKKVRKQLAEERDARDELERDLANASQLITEREKQISQLQHRVERLMRDNAEQAQEPKELEELQNKNEGLQTRLHEVLKQCQDLKTDNSQMEKKIDQLTEENGNLSVKIRDIVSRLASAQETVDTLSDEQQALQAEWESKKKFLETELYQAVSQKESLNEQVQILQGKISFLEDELRNMQTQTQEQGEVMGPIMEWEKLNQEVSELTCKLSQLQETVLQLENEKGEMQIKYEMEKNKFESEAVHLQGLVSELQQTLLVHRGERESLEQTLKEQQAAMTTQISLMNAEIACLSETIKQKDLAATALGEEVAAEQKQRGILQEKMEKREKINAETIQGLSQQVEHLETFLKFKQEESSHQQTILKEASDRVICERDAISAEYHQFREEKEEEVLSLNQQVRQLGELRQMELSIMSDLKRDKEALDLKLATLECTVSDLMNGQEAEREKHREAIAAELQRHSQMESEIMALETRVQQLLRDIELMGQRLNEAQKAKCDAESNVEELKIECRELSNSLSAERDYNNLMVNERDTVIKTLQVKTEEMEKLEKETKECMVEVEAITTAKRNGETRLNCVIEKHKAEICTLRLELTDLQCLVKQRDSEKELLQNEISSKEEELKIQQEHVLNLQSATSEMEELCKNLAEEEKRHQMTKQGADARNEENRLLRITLDEKENQMSTLQQNIHVLEEKAYDLQVVMKNIEDYKHTISELKTRLVEDQAQIREKTAAFEIQNQQVLSLQKDLVLEQERAVSLENDLRAVESVLGNQKVQEQKLRAEAIVHSEELEKRMADLEKLQQQFLLLEEEKREAERRDVTASEKIAMLQVELQTISSQASESNASLEQVQKEFAAVSLELSSLKEKYNERSKLADADCKRQEMTIEKLNNNLQSASSLASEKEQNIQMLQTEISSLKRELKEQQAVECLRDQEMNAIRSKCIEQEKNVSELQVQLQEASALASERESELCSLRCEMKVNDNLRLQAAAREEALRKELEEKVAQLQVQLLETSSLNSLRESELHFLYTKVKEMNNLKVKAAETEEAQRREFEDKIAQLQAQIVEAAALATEKESELQFLRSEEVKSTELERKIGEHEELQNVSALVIEKQQKKETLREELKERDLHREKDILRNQATECDRNETMATFANPKAKLLGTSEHLGGNAEEPQQYMVAPKHSNVEHLSIMEGLKKKEFSQKLTEDLRTQLQLAVEELSELRPLRGAVREKSQLLRDLQEQLSAKSKALEHYKAQVENAKTHYNGKKQQLLEANEKVQTLTTALKTSQQEIETLKGQMKVFQEQAKATEKNLLLTVNSLQAQLDYADKQLRELKRPGKSDEMKPKESVYQMITEKQEDISGDSLDLSLDDSLNFTRIPAKREESSTPVVRSSERLKAKRRTCSGESLETLYFTPMSIRSAADSKQESSINSLGELVVDSARKSSSARRRTTQVINITMTKKTQSRLEADAHDGSFNSLQTAQSFPNIASQRDRPFSLELSEESTTTDLLQHLPGYRRSAAPSAVSSRRISTFRVGAENEPDHSENWMRIAELQARNQTCLPHLKSSYPLETQPNFGNISFTITDDDLKMGDPNETIRRASMIPGQIRDSLASSRLSVQPSQIRDGTLSRRETMLPAGIGSRATSQPAVLNPKRCGSNSLNTRPLKRGSCDPQGPGTSEAKKLASCFPRPLTPKDRNDRHFASQNSQNRPPSTPVERRQSMMFCIDNTPNKKGKNSLLQKGINKVRATTRKSPGSSRKIPRSAKSPCPGKSPHGERPQRRSPRINSMKSPKIISSARKNVNAPFMECVQREGMAPEMEEKPRSS
ncbi:hypothetical protein GJAV_G00054360 [Gymnothorax javanicus]|nr:hypothetical protein GJAV_G00054360 [Gymnothorax javanicus]